jgi:[acyl-carrier-protein] S-malonyltransferase
MGKDLFEAEAIAKEFFERADSALGFSLSKFCFEGPAEELTATAVAQPAILTVSTIAYNLAITARPEIKPAVAAGHSLGEYSALVAAGALDFEDAVRLVNRRGSYMQDAVPRGQGKMAAVLGKEISDVEQAIESIDDPNVQIANINAPGQIVVAGSAAGIDKFIESFVDAKIKELDVSAPFHSPLMKPAADKLAQDLAEAKIKAPEFPVYSNFLAEPLSDPEKIRAALIDQVCGRVRWVECMQHAIEQFKPSVAVEFGAGRVLTGLLKRIDKGLNKANVYAAQDI